MNKICSKCHVEKAIAFFSPGSSWCKVCRNAKMGERGVKLKESGERMLRPERAKSLPREKKMTMAEWEVFWPVVDNANFRLFFDVVQSLGLRAHEGLALTRESFALDNGLVTIHTLKRKDGHVLELPVRPDLLAHIHASDGPLFPFTYDRMLDAFKRYAKRAPKLSPRLSLHALRHLCGTRLYMAKASNEEIGYFLRHKPRSMQERYIEIPNDRLIELAEAMWEKQTWLWRTFLRRDDPEAIVT